jgi:antitoxin HicB
LAGFEVTLYGRFWVTPEALARRLNCHMPQIDRLVDLRHASRLDQLEAAFRALGKQLSVEIREAA